MKRLFLLFIFLLPVFESPAQTLCLDSRNPHYLNYQGKPVVLITSAEHYGAVLNEDFDFETYLQTLQRQGMNYTRIFLGSYVEMPGDHGINKNTLSPATGKFITPWSRTDMPALVSGEKKLDLSKWNPLFFERLHLFLKEAERHKIIVELTFFCATYSDGSWKRHPFNPGNNTNNLGLKRRGDTNTLADPLTVSFQKRLIEKVVEECNAYDHIFYELSNEPWVDNPSFDDYLHKTNHLDGVRHNWALWAVGANDSAMEWQRELAGTIVETEKRLPQKHLIAQNYTNFKYSLPDVDSNVAILNFHYAWPEVVKMNYGWDRPVSFDESGFAGSADSTYLDQAWSFMLSGGAIFNNLDYSFYVEAEDGTGNNEAPGGGSARLRQQLQFLQEFLSSADFISFKPDYSVLYHLPGQDGQALSRSGQQYLIYLSGRGNGTIQLDLPEGKFQYEFYQVDSGELYSSGILTSEGVMNTLEIPDFYRCALKISRQE